jgi:serine protease Do
VRQGDVIVALDDRPVHDANMLRNSVASLRPGSTVRVAVLRDGRREQLTARLAEREETRAASKANGKSGAPATGFGMSVEPLTASTARELGVPENLKGVVVTDVEQDGVAASAGLRPGDIITRVDGRDVATVDALRTALRRPVSPPALVLVRREEATIFIAVPRQQT